MSLSSLELIRSSSLRLGSVLSRRLSDFPKLQAQLRLSGQAGSRRSRQLRQGKLQKSPHFLFMTPLMQFLPGFTLEKQVPGVVYGQDDDGNVLKRMVTVDKLALTRELGKQGKSFENTLYELEVQEEGQGTRYLVVPRQVQLCPGTERGSHGHE
ncbi:hypothetical protein EON64_15765 [archaeon]|nr:MAG: hypothetical protein EON64_15765 [archaeon]